MPAIRPERATTTPLAELLAGLPVELRAQPTLPISGISLDSRAMADGWLYAALPGANRHGAEFVGQALAAGAAAVLTDEAGAKLCDQQGVPLAVSDELRGVLGPISARVFGEPAKHLTTFGVTGTNGKTTTVALLAAALAEAGLLTGTIGTIGFRLGDEQLVSDRGTVTTPEAPDLQALLEVMRQRGARSAALEVSSHALAMDRVGGISFDVASFLNLGHDHADFHGDQQHYFEAKAKLLTPELTRHGVCWIDDPRGAQLAQRAREAGLPVTTAGASKVADYQLLDYREVLPLGGQVTVRRAGQEIELNIALPGRYNMIDAVIAFAMLEAVDIPSEAVIAGLAKATVPGRMEAVRLPGPAPQVVVDFAHTPQAVSAALVGLRGRFERVIAVLGCGGDRDVRKRPAMGEAAAKLADVVVVTDDNPRSEPPAEIRAQVMAGAIPAARESGSELVEVAGRAAAIETALARAEPGNVVAILGKGHEQGQIIEQRVLDFDDVVAAREAWTKITGLET